MMRDSNKRPGALNFEEAARHLGISVRGMHRLKNNKEIRHSRIGGRVVFRPQVLDQFLESKEVI
jgi:excisionase family DNA binding protein